MLIMWCFMLHLFPLYFSALCCECDGDDAAQRVRGGATQACGQSPETLKRGTVESCMASHERESCMREMEERHVDMRDA